MVDFGFWALKIQKIQFAKDSNLIGKKHFSSYNMGPLTHGVFFNYSDIWAIFPSHNIFLLQLKKIRIYDPPVGILLD